MTSRSKYNTKQRSILLDYLKTIPGVHITAGDVCRYFRSNEIPIGQATVYRQLESLVDEGVIKKYNIDGSSAACFEYTGQDGHTDGESSYHCKCEKCGKLIHLHCGGLDEIQTHLSTEHRFKLDPVRTVFYGICEDCIDHGK